MRLRYVDSEECEFKGKRVLVRCDFNVPLLKNDSSELVQIADTTRIDRALPTINLLLQEGASKIILMGHLGRPKGKVVDHLSLAPVAEYLSQKLNSQVFLTETALDSGIKSLLKLPKTKIVMLENLRFHPEEKNRDREFARHLAQFGDLYVNDAFGTCHRKHSSTYDIISFFERKAFAGILLKNEIKALSRLVKNPARPFVAIMGGAKIADKIKIVEQLLVNVDHLLVGGAMAYPFLKASGVEVGKSHCTDEDVALAHKILKTNFSHKIVLPMDHIVSTGTHGQPVVEPNVPIGAEFMGLDVGQKTLNRFADILKEAKTVLWNGPMGMFENNDYRSGTNSVAQLLADLDAFTLVGGGDSVSAVNLANLGDKMSHVSTGGGASLEFIEQGTLVAIEALKF